MFIGIMLNKYSLAEPTGQVSLHAETSGAGTLFVIHTRYMMFHSLFLHRF